VTGAAGTRLALACCLALAGCATAGADTPALQYLGQVQVPPGATMAGTVVGGLSGLSYDAADQLFYIVSDDRSEKNPARFYTARIRLSDSGVGSVGFTGTAPWRTVDGRPFAPLDVAARPPVVPPDAEGIAVDSVRQRLYWSSEGERITDAPGGPVLLDPWVRIADLDGRYLGEFTLPPQLRMAAGPTGPRQNKALEGLTLSPGGRYLWAGMEAPGYNDGEPPTAERGALTRITRFDVGTLMATAEYAYPLDAVSAGPGGDNGLSDLVALDDTSFLTVERGYGDHVAVRIYYTQVGDADDVLAAPALDATGVRPMAKTLVADLTTIPGLTPLDNVEGITLGPALPDGRRSVVLVSDDNFSPTQVTQVLAFAL
jgi:hypothetical protein